jgi:DNA-binding PadR family transcriptional regulator
MRIERELMRGAGPVAVLQLLEKRPMYGSLSKKGVARLHADRKQWRDLVTAMKGLGLLGSSSTGK